MNEIEKMLDALSKITGAIVLGFMVWAIFILL